MKRIITKINPSSLVLYRLSILFFLILISCSKDKDYNTSQEPLPLVISSFMPSGYVGDEVVLTAQNINSNTEYLVKLGDATLDNILVTETNIKGRIPSGAISGEISVEYDETSLFVGSFEVMQSFLVTNYSPTSGYIGDEIIIQAENIDTTTTYSIKIDGIVASNISANEIELKVRIPAGANTGDITIEYDQFNISIGPFEVFDTTDELYICNYPDGYFDCYPKPKIYKIDLASGQIIEEPWVFDLAWGCSAFFNSSQYNPRSNTLLSHYETGGGTYGSRVANVLNLNTGTQTNYLLDEYDVYGQNYYKRFGSVGDEKLFFNKYFQNPNTGEYSTKLKAKNFDNQEETILYDSSFNLGYTSCFVPSINSYISYSSFNNNDIYFNRLDLSLQTVNTTTINDYIREIIITSDDVIYGLRRINNNTYEIVQIDPTTGEVIEVMHTINNRVESLNFSESSNRFYVGYFEEYGSTNKVYIYKLDTEASSILTLDGDLTLFELMLKY